MAGNKNSGRKSVYQEAQDARKLQKAFFDPDELERIKGLKKHSLFHKMVLRAEQSDTILTSIASKLFPDLSKNFNFNEDVTDYSELSIEQLRDRERELDLALTSSRRKEEGQASARKEDSSPEGDDGPLPLSQGHSGTTGHAGSPTQRSDRLLTGPKSTETPPTS